MYYTAPHCVTFYGVLHPLVNISLMKNATESLEYRMQPLGGEFFQQLSHLFDEVHRYFNAVIRGL